MWIASPLHADIYLPFDIIQRFCVVVHKKHLEYISRKNRIHSRLSFIEQHVETAVQGMRNQIVLAYRKHLEYVSFTFRESERFDYPNGFEMKECQFWKKLCSFHSSQKV